MLPGIEAAATDRTGRGAGVRPSGPAVDGDGQIIDGLLCPTRGVAHQLDADPVSHRCHSAGFERSPETIIRSPQLPVCAAFRSSDRITPPSVAEPKRELAAAAMERPGAPLKEARMRPISSVGFPPRVTIRSGSRRRRARPSSGNGWIAADGDGHDMPVNTSFPAVYQCS
jgi:hypothetical protein